MIEHVYTIGDSLTAGAEIQEDYSMDQSNKAFAYPLYFANKLKIKHCNNRALPEAPNEFIVRKTILDLEAYKNKGIDLSTVFVLVGWTGLNKTEINMKNIINGVDSDAELKFELLTDVESQELELFQTQFISETSSKNKGGKLITDICNTSIEWLKTYMWDYELEYEKWYANIILLKNYLENNQCKFLFHNTMHKCEVISKVYDFDNYFQPRGESFNEWCTTNNYERRALLNPVEDAHADFADILVEYVKEKKLI